MLMMRTEADYDVRLTDFVRRWESKNPAEAAELRAVVQRQMGFAETPTGPLVGLAFEMQFREAVREKMGKPTMRAWMRGDNG